MLLLIPVAAGLLTVLAALAVQMMRTTGLEAVEESMRAIVAGDARERGIGPFLDRLGSRFLGFAMRLYGPVRLKNLDDTIRRAGRPDGLTVTAYVRRQAGFVVMAVLAVLLFAVIGRVVFGLVIGAVFVAWMRLWLVSVGAKRQAQIDSDLPDFLDVLGITVTAGLGFRQAVERVCEFHTGPLGEEMITAIREMAVGVSRRQAFLGMRDRTRSEAVGTFVTALLQAEELGVPLAAALNDIASDVRKEHAQAVRQAAAKAAPKVSLVVTMTIVPGALILIGSAVVLANLDALRGIF